MKKCLNCNGTVRDKDVYCRNCGCMLHSDKHYVFINILNILMVIAIIFVLLLFITSYLI